MYWGSELEAMDAVEAVEVIDVKGGLYSAGVMVIKI